MPVATSTLIAAALVTGAVGKSIYDAKKAGQQPLPPITLEPPPQYEKPDFARAVRLQRAKTTGASGRAGTIKTGPSGITNPAAAKPKTLIGE